MAIFTAIFTIYAEAQEQAVIVMDAGSGRILRLDNSKIAVETAFSPGSLLKIFAALYGLKANIIDPSTIVHCNGHFDINDKQLPCWDRTGHGAVDLYKALAYSCNVYFYHQAIHFDEAGFSKYTQFLRTMGFGQKTGIDLPNENAGSVPDIYNSLEQIKAAAGSTREILVTPIQVITAFAAVVNGGKLLTPFQNTLPTDRAAEKENLALDAQLPIIQRALQEGATYGTSAGFFQETGGFAKTGTAPQADPLHTDAWFVGYFPFQDKKLVILVFKTNGTGAKDALPIGLQIARELKNKTLDSEPVTVSLFSLLKPKSVIVTGRFGLLTVKSENVGGQEAEQLEPITCRRLEIKQKPGGLIEVWIDGAGKSMSRFVEICPLQSQGFCAVQPVNGEDRNYPGQITVCSNGEYLEIINHLPLCQYLSGVIDREMGAMQAWGGSHFEEVLKCQAILSRTYALKNLKRHDRFDFCDTTHCQHYAGTPDQPGMIERVVRETGGIVLTYNGQLSDIYYHSTCGGFTADAEGVWEDKGIPYLRSIDDGNRCQMSPHYRWHFQVPETELFALLKTITGETPVDLRLKEVGKNGWVKQIALIYKGGREKILRGEEYHIFMGRRLGWNTFKSANFTFIKNVNDWEFTGRGLGHGVGLCQYGACSLAQGGKDYREILATYFPGAVLKVWTSQSFLKSPRRRSPL
ncbi:MAG: SpoIID/LytB domain-containing protein [Acidobacteria bacterium]|nr:SpoIID/LytB domain-containing protein [Acidobacteriota bacterium]